MIQVSVGTKNKAKISAVKSILKTSNIFIDCNIVSQEVATGVNDQPMSLDETINGAKNRAKNSFIKNITKFSIGIESGFMKVDQAESKFMEFTACSIYDGTKFYLGLSPCFEIPEKIMKFVLDGQDLAKASNLAGYSNNPNLGSEQGIIGILTKGRKTRMQYTEDSIIMALINLENN